MFHGRVSSWNRAQVGGGSLMGAARSNGPERPVRIPAGRVTLDGDLASPEAARGVVLFAHGSGSSRFSPRNRYVAQVLREGGLATLLIDLLTPEEEAIDVRTAQLRFDIRLLAERLVGATDWLFRHPETQRLRVGYFGASTGGGAALVAAAELPDVVGAVVSRGGRPDLAGPALARVRAPTLLIVGGRDSPVIEMNREALGRLRAEKQLEIVPGATHLFEEPGALEEVARLARAWFQRYLTPANGRGLHPAAARATRSP
jgi:dienelactone hydrolase